MFSISRAKPADLDAIRYLLSRYGSKLVVLPEHINHRDVALQARHNDTGELVGFLWCGLMAKNKIGYIDKFTVSPEFSKHGIGNLMALRLLQELVKIGVKQVFGIIKHDEYTDKSAMNALKLAMASDGTYMHVYADIKNSLLEMKNLGKV